MLFRTLNQFTPKQSMKEKLLQALQEGLISHESVVEMFIDWNTSSDIREMLQSNDVNLDDQQSEDE